MSSPPPKTVLYAQSAEIAEALGEIHRLELWSIWPSGSAVEELAVRADLTLANACRHLRAMRWRGAPAPARDEKQILHRAERYRRSRSSSFATGDA